MRILAITIQNFRKLLQCHIEFSEKTTLFVGANNSGKTSAMDALGKFLADRNFNFTHQGVKGLEFPRVMVILDDAQAKGFLFSYEKLFGVKAQSDTDIKNERDGKDTGITRTARLFYVACTRAENSLAVVAYTENEELVKATALSNGWFLENEIYII